MLSKKCVRLRKSSHNRKLAKALRSLFWRLSSSLLLGAVALAAPSPSRPHHVILITIDTVRADHTGPYGAKGVATPTLDALAHDGIVFDRAISQVPLTWPSHAVILTGTYPFQNGVQDFTGQPLDPRFTSVAQVFKQQGYATGAVVSAFVLDRSWGLARGFDFYDDAFSSQSFLNRDLGLVDRKAGESVSRAINWLEKNTRRPVFFWLHLYDPHSPYDPPEPYRTQYQDHPYEGEIAYADHELGRLIAWLKRNQLYDRSLIVTLSDHGESLGEHGENEHGFFIYNSTVHIPLVVKPPAGSGLRPGHEPRPVETVAVAPTLLRLAGLKNAVVGQFSSPALLGDGENQNDTAYSETFYPFSSFGWNPLRALESGRYHYIDAPEPELYDLEADPQEKNNIVSDQTATVAVLRDKLHKLEQQNPFTPQGSAADLSPEAQEKLRALGYVSFRSPVPRDALAKGLPDPKSKLWEFNTILAAQDAFRTNDPETGKKLLGRVDAKDPKMYIVGFLLGEAALTEKNWQEAADQFKRCLQLSPNFDQAMTGLSRALMYLGDERGAKAWVENALKYNPENYRAWYQLGAIEAKRDRQAAMAAYERAAQIQGNFAPVRRELGLLYYQQKRYESAARHLARAVELGLEDPLMLNNLGISYSLTGRIQKAVSSYKQALQLDPNLAQAHLNLGYAYQQLNRATEAHREYQAACHLQANFCALVPQSK
jgi:arylsulfatase A-like enzyme/Tfp pilus assembly protein PilF